MRKLSALATLCGIIVALASLDCRAETLRKRYTFTYDRTTRKASSMVAEKQARKRLLRDFLAEKFSPEITSKLADDIDMALDPPDQYLTSFNVISEKVSDDESQVVLTVEGEFDLASMVTALVDNKVLSFGKDAPKVMVMPSARFEDPGAAKSVRALIFDKIKQAGLRPVAFENTGESITFRVRDKVMPGEPERQILVRQAKEYGADYIIYIDAQAETRPFSQGGYISDANFIYTILRPNGGLILGESVVSDRGSGASAMVAFDRALDSVAPVIAKAAIGQLFQAIYSDSDVIYNVPQTRQEKTLVIHAASAPLVQAVVERLRNAGTKATLSTGTSDVASRVKLETGMDDFDLYEWFNAQTFAEGEKVFKTPVVAYSENVIEVEATPAGEPPRLSPIAKAPARRVEKISQPRAQKKPDPAVPAEHIARVTLKLRPAQFNR